MSALVKELLRNYYNIDDNSKFDLDMAINFLIDSGNLDEEERIILQLVIDQVHHSSISEAVGRKKSTVNAKITRIAKKIADYLGAEYQDEKILEEAELRLGRKLTSDEEKFCWKIIRAGRPIKGINIFNFKAGKDAKRGKGKAKRPMGL